MLREAVMLKKIVLVAAVFGASMVSFSVGRGGPAGAQKAFADGEDGGGCNRPDETVCGEHSCPSGNGCYDSACCVGEPGRQ